MMDKQEELEKAVLDICVCGEIMMGVGKRLAQVFNVSLPKETSVEAASEKTPQPAEPSREEAAPAPTLEDVRAVLAQKSIEGLTDKVKALITKFGAKKLSDVPPEKYGELLKEAEALGHGG